MEKLSGVIFDMDGLILDTEMIYYKATQKVADEMGFPYDKAVYMRFLGVSDKEAWAAYHEMYQDKGKAEVQRFIDETSAEVERLFERGEAAVKPGLDVLLDYLDQQNIPKVIASSNQRHIIELLLESANLCDTFDDIVSCEDVALAKPDPEIFEVAVKRLQTPKNETLVLEDSRNGILAAEAAAIPVIMIPDLLAPSPELAAKTLAVLDSLADVPQYFGK